MKLEKLLSEGEGHHDPPELWSRPSSPTTHFVVAAGVAAVGCAAGVIGTFGVLRKRALVE